MSIIDLQNIENFSTQTAIPFLGPLFLNYQFLQGESIGFSQFCLHINCSMEMCKKLIPHHNTKMQCDCHGSFACNKKSENSLFSSHFPIQDSYWNLYISYGHNFSIEWIPQIMYWNWKPPKTLNSTHHKYGHFYWIMSRDFQQCSTMAKHIITVTFCFGPYDSKSS